MAANVQESGILGQGSELLVEQLEQLLKNLSGGHKISVNNAHLEEEIDNIVASFAGMVSCFCGNAKVTEWIIDSGASDHITGTVAYVNNHRPIKAQHKINLPNGATSKITHCGSVLLENGLVLKDVLVVLEFKHSLLSVKKPIDSEN